METHLVAGPPRPNPPLPVAAMIVMLSLTAPFLFLRAGVPSWWLTSAILFLAFAGIVAVFGAVSAQAKRNVDSATRVRATISADGITFLPTPAGLSHRFFPSHQIEHAHLFNSALILKTTPLHPTPGRHVLRFGRLACPRADVLAALSQIQLAPDAEPIKVPPPATPSPDPYLLSPPSPKS